MDMAKLCTSNVLSGPFVTWRASRPARFSSCNALFFPCKVSCVGRLRREERRHGGFQRRMLLAAVAEEGEGSVATAEEKEADGEKGDEDVVEDSNEGKEDVSSALETQTAGDEDVDEDGELTPEEEEDQECVDQIVRVLDLLKENRDMIPNEVRLIVMIEDPREESLGMLNEKGEWTSLRDEMGNAVVDISEGRVPENREVLKALRDELLSWPNLEITPGKTNARSSVYAQLNESGVDPATAGEQANADWDAAAEIVPGKKQEFAENVPPAMGFSILYFVSAIPVIIGLSVVAILYFTSFQ